jgi:hypothetical protein
MAAHERPCFVSEAQSNEFEQLVSYAKRETGYLANWQIRRQLERMAPLSHDLDAVMRCAAADLAMEVR